MKFLAILLIPIIAQAGITYRYNNSAVLPIGTSISFRGSTCPSGFLAEDGSAVSRTTYADLFNTIGTIYGSGDGSTTFNLPDAEDVAEYGSSASNTVGTLTGTDTIDLSHDHGMSHTHQVNPPNTTTTTDNGTSQAASILGLLGAVTPPNYQHNHDVDIQEFVSGAASATTTGSALSTIDKKPRRLYSLRCIKAI